MNKIVQTFQYGDNEMRLETGQIARQASGAVLASLGETVVLVTVVAARGPIFSHSQSTMRKERTPQEGSRVGFSNVRGVRQKRRFLLQG